MPENSQTGSSADYKEVALKLADRIPAVLIAFVFLFLIFISSLIWSIGYLPSNKRFSFDCIIVIAGFVALVLISGFLYFLIVYIIKNKNSSLLN
ncbi:hypothetical protein [Lactiplantibacillus plantarum]|uniref:hypothetical protein n=1 Tax=Lactiplantibacillus plantarum TaxID=1590 RepID=UPI003A857A53